MNKKVVLAYSGGLDTSVILKWLEVEMNFDVIAVCIDVGQGEKHKDIWEKAINIGAKKVYIVDVKEEFVKDYIFKGVKAGAIYENDYLLGTAYARPLIAEKLVEIAHKEGAVAIAHGATGKGNDQVRFESGIIAIDPSIQIISPWRIWSLKSREDCIDYAKKYNIPLPVTKEDIYSRDENLWHISHEGGELENTWNVHSKSIYKWCRPKEIGPDIPEIYELGFKGGIPVSINGENYKPVELIEYLNIVGSKHGVGVIDIVENRLVGMKSRGVYETPAGTIIYEAHKALERLVLDKSSIRFKNTVSLKYADILYDGQWFSELRKSLDAFVDSTQKNVTGCIKISLFKGNVTVIASKSPYSLYQEEYVTFGEDDVYNQQDAEGFINLFSLPLKINNIVNGYKVKKNKTNIVSVYSKDDLVKKEKHV